MRLIIRDYFFQEYCLRTKDECDKLLFNQDCLKIFIEGSYGDNFYVIIKRNSLDKAPLSAIGFNSYGEVDEILIIDWQAYNTTVICTSESLYFLDGGLNVISTSELESPLIGAQIYSERYLIILEEANIRAMDHHGAVLWDFDCDLIDNSSLSGEIFSIRTVEGDNLKLDIESGQLIN